MDFKGLRARPGLPRAPTASKVAARSRCREPCRREMLRTASPSTPSGIEQHGEFCKHLDRHSAQLKPAVQLLIDGLWHKKISVFVIGQNKKPQSKSLCIKSNMCGQPMKRLPTRIRLKMFWGSCQGSEGFYPLYSLSTIYMVPKRRLVPGILQTLCNQCSKAAATRW